MIDEIKQIKNICDSLNDESSKEDRKTAYIAVLDILACAEASGKFVSVKTSKPFWTDTYYDYYNLNGFCFCVARYSDKDRYIYVESEKNQYGDLFNTIKNALKIDSKIEFGDKFDAVIGDYLFNDTNLTIGEISYTYQFMLQRIINEISNMNHIEFYSFCKKTIENDLKIEMEDYFISFYLTAWRNVNPIDLDDYALILMGLKQHVLNVANSEIICNVAEFIANESGFAVISNLIDAKSFEIILPSNYHSNNIDALIDSINAEFNLDCDYMKHGKHLTVWLELKAIF